MENSIEEIEELKRLLYRNELTQYGKRKLISYYEKQEKDYKRVLKENEELKNNKSIVEKILHKGKGFTLQQTQYIWEHYIPKSKVKDKIEEIDKIYNDIPEDEGNFTKAILIKEKQALQELLEGRK